MNTIEFRSLQVPVDDVVEALRAEGYIVVEGPVNEKLQPLHFDDLKAGDLFTWVVDRAIPGEIGRKVCVLGDPYYGWMVEGDYNVYRNGHPDRTDRKGWVNRVYDE